MIKISTLVIDCDGVLYPLSELSTREIVSAMKDVYRNQAHISGDIQVAASDKTIREGHLGMFNYIKEMCNQSGYDFKLFCRQLADKIDYSRIKPNPLLLKMLQKKAQEQKVVIFSNNSAEHLEKVMLRLFGKTRQQMEETGISVYDITVVEKDGYFLPKQSREGLTFFLRKLNKNPEESMLLDDTQTNIQAAKRQGMQALLITPEKSLQKYLSGETVRTKTMGRSL